jgi:YceI-like domain
MPSYDARNAECHVFTFKEGVLSAVSHDLRMRVERFTIEIDHTTGAIEACFFADSLRVDCAMKKGREAYEVLRAGHKRDIEANIASTVLHATKYPEIEFRSTRVEGEGDERRISGTLALHGVQRPLQITARRRANRWVTEVELQQPDFNIKLYPVLLGPYKIQSTVRVRVSVPG